jgi:hypothetical protein
MIFMQIDHDIPVPPRKRWGNGRPPTYPFAELEIGASFQVAPEAGALVGAAAAQWKKRHLGWDYRTRKTATECRLWRTA